jgi:hypothetical protein
MEVSTKSIEAIVEKIKLHYKDVQNEEWKPTVKDESEQDRLTHMHSVQLTSSI